MSRVSTMYRKRAASGPIVAQQDSRGATFYVRAHKTREEFERSLPKNMKEENRNRIVNNNYKK